MRLRSLKYASSFVSRNENDVNLELASTVRRSILRDVYIRRSILRDVYIRGSILHDVCAVLYWFKITCFGQQLDFSL